MNKELLLQIKERILAEPNLFSMTGYYKKMDCGTSHCIAGWAVHLTEGDKGLHLGDFHNRACTALGISYGQGHGLFYDDEWPRELSDEYNENTDKKERAQIAARAIDRFIESPWVSKFFIE